MNFKSSVYVILMWKTHLLNKMGLSRMKIVLETIRSAKCIFEPKGLGKIEETHPSQFLYGKEFHIG